VRKAPEVYEDDVSEEGAMTVPDTRASRGREIHAA
jgi:hypothetical protein